MSFEKIAESGFRVRQKLAVLFLFSSAVVFAQQGKEVSGKITNDKQAPVPNVTVKEEGTENSVTTDDKGNFIIKLLKDQSSLSVENDGFQSQIIAVDNRSFITIPLKEERTKAIEQVVLVGYGSVKKSDLTGSVNTLSSDKIVERNTTSPLEAIQGSMAGVNITSNSGRVGDGFKMTIRGNNSLISSGNPLYVVDGVPTDNIDFLNPQDIARMDVLKDASSAAIYGSRGASGVVLVTTKNGATAKAGINVSLETSYGVRTATRLPKMMTGAEWWNFHQAAYLNATPNNQTPAQLATLAGNQSPLLVQRANNGYNFDWYDAVLQPGTMQNHYVNISGRSDGGFGYNLSFGIQGNEGIIANDSNDKYTFKLGINHKINSKFSTGANITVARTVTEYGSDSAMRSAFSFSPLISPYAIDSNGNDIQGQLFLLPGKLTYPDGSWAINKTSTINPLLEIANSRQNERIWQTLGNLFFQYQPKKWLSFKTTFSVGFSNSNLGISNTAQTNVGIALINKNSASVSKTENFNYTWDNQIDLKHTFNDVHDVSLLLLQSLYSNEDESSYGYSNGQPFDMGFYNLGFGLQSSYQLQATPYMKRTLNSYAVRLNYGFKDKYLLTASTRWDGSSVLSEENKWTAFPSLALGWKINKESFLENVKTISDLKLRASIGYTGNDNVAPYQSLALLDQQTFYANGNALVPGLQSSVFANQFLTWEKTRELNFGLDFGFLRNRITGSVDVYDRLSENLIYRQQLPAEMGLKYTYGNVGSVSNKGVEVLLVTKNIKSNLINWETTFTFTKNVNKLESIYNQDQVSDKGNLLILESSLNPNFNYVYDGVWQESEATQAAAYGMAPGQARPKDINGDGKFDANDRTVIGSSVPKWQGSFYSRLTIGKFDFNFSIITSQGQTVLSTFHQNFADVSDRGRQKMAMEYFVPTNSAGLAANANNTNPRPGPVATGAGAFWSTGFGYYRDISFTKVKNISLGYTFSPDFLQKIKISNLRIYVNVLDPFVFTKFDGYDPEWAAANMGINRPAAVTTQLGLSAKF
ncbi:SusC/RagA family TonB-linked outer membrane protein [Chryseobacterium sp. Leaf405]|uniref:SusC/RagA family TonB-linked outer membrane protein n=1 Tax=Chryseobacterium sp. Leaf405 TaxID=1736367 RepID=UPI000700C45A|nr:SusC/RagA family TonB-linked outer membrane protein [Chryseobacterium sp. Leaf405]KQT30982.1 SusC/RagA family TonB-linked outer membrane protein [Chryseobacterium sp. Leaf405]